MTSPLLRSERVGAPPNPRLSMADHAKAKAPSPCSRAPVPSAPLEAASTSSTAAPDASSAMLRFGTPPGR